MENGSRNFRRIACKVERELSEDVERCCHRNGFPAGTQQISTSSPLIRNGVRKRGADSALSQNRREEDIHETSVAPPPD
jgi:hypothetical protein